jgi:hypothetical protein
VVAVAAAAVVVVTVHARTPDPDRRRPPPSAAFLVDDTAIPDDATLGVELEHAIDLRLREHFDRVLDAREEGELIEHATLSDTALDRHVLGIDTLFIVGDELFGYQFRPENGWGSGTATDRKASSYTPRLRRIHLAASGGPDAFACVSCHSKGGPDGAGTQTQNAFMRGDGERTRGADQRNPPQVLGLGPIACLAREMSAELRAEAAAASTRAKTEGHRVEQALTTKGISFGRIAAEPDGTLDGGGVEGVDADLVVRPFGWKGHQASLRDIAEESFHLHQGLISTRIQFAIRDGALDAGPYGKGPWYDVDEDDVSSEILDAMLTTMVGYLAQLEAPTMRPPRDPGLVDAWAAGRTRFDEIGCAACTRAASPSSSTSPRTATARRSSPGTRATRRRTSCICSATSSGTTWAPHSPRRRRKERFPRACSSRGRSGVSPTRRRTCTTAARRPCTTRSCFTAARRPAHATPTWRSTSRVGRACASS